jgi:hypothetical protein
MERRKDDGERRERRKDDRENRGKMKRRGKAK